MSEQHTHTPVMLVEVVEHLAIMPGKWYIDATFGRGGYTETILDQGAFVVAFDHDAEAVAYGEKQFEYELAHNKLIIIRENFLHLSKTISDLRERTNVGDIQGVVYDFGTSSEQLTSIERGFSFSGSAPLDMRMDDRLGVTAADLLHVLSEKQLTQLFQEKGGEHQARSIAKKIVAQRATKPVTTTQELVSIITKAKSNHSGKLHPATKVFQALRIAVNDELTNIEESLPQAVELIVPGGHVVTVAFHQGEDAIAKQVFRQAQIDEIGETTGPFTPSEIEVVQNPRARSAKLRVFRKAV